MDNTKYTFVRVFWLICISVGTWVVYTISPPLNISFWEIIIFSGIACLLACIPITINGTTIILSHWISLAAFLSYGLFFEMFILQVATLCVMIRVKLKRPEFYKYFINSSMMFLTSLIAGLGFFLVGGKTGYSTLQELIIPVLVYQILYFITNQLLLQTVTLIGGKSGKVFGKDVIWEALIFLVVSPLGLGFYYLNESVGLLSVFLIGVPVISFALVLKLYNSSEKVNDSLQKAAEIGHQLTERLHVKEVLDMFIQKISQNMPVDFAYILDVQQEGLIMLRQMEHGEQKTINQRPLRKNEGIAGNVWISKKAVIYNERSEWESKSIGNEPKNAESIMCVPIIRGQEVEGVLLLASTRKNVYEKYQLMIVDILCSYFSVALVNARNYEETRRNSEHCALTKLYNYRFFERCLNEKISDMDAGKYSAISLVMLDIDHFKQVNDTYGHQAGNEILAKLADRLNELMDGQGIIARYGGEEFVILLTDVSQESALIIAESIRQMVAFTPFIVQNELDPFEDIVEVSITVSIGVATAPEDADDALSLVRHADRALYVGAKRAGRNRISEYAKI